MLSRIRDDLSWNGLREGWRASQYVLALFILALVLRFAHLLDEQGAGVLLAIGAPCAALLYFAGRPRLGRSRRHTLAVAATAALCLVVSTAPSLDALLPGAPRAVGEVNAVGDTLHLPSGLRGAVRILVHATLGRRGDDVVALRMTGTAVPLEVEFERRVSHRERGTRQQHVVSTTPEFRYVPATIPAMTTALEVERFVGSADHPVRLEVYRPAISPWWAGMACLAALVGIVVLSLRVRLPPHGVAMAAFAIGFGMVMSRTATPGSAVGPAAVALLVGSLVGIVVRALVDRVHGPSKTRGRRGSK